MTPALTTAQALLAAGIAAIPTRADKRPVIEWRRFMHELPTEAELAKWFAKDSGIALVGGRVLCLDFDEKYSAGIHSRFAARAAECGLTHLLSEAVRQKTPSGGYHLVWACDGKRVRNLKLAEKLNHEVMIETRGEGGYFLIAPSPGYVLEQGDWSSIPSISEDDRDALLSLARSFDQRQPVEANQQASAPSNSNETTPGDDYDARADVPALLRQHGWKSAGPSGKYWTRPGKTKGISASWDVIPRRMFVFSSSTEFQPQHVYRPWHIYAMLECGGDFSRAASELRRQGFGGKRARVSAPLPWDDVEEDSEPLGVEPCPDDPPGIEGVDPRGEAPTIETEDDRIRRLLRARAFDPSKVPPPLRPIYSLGGVVICTPGNLCAITAQAKVGKSALVSALTAAAMTPEGSGADLLTAVGFNEAGKALIYIDTEQAPDDFWHAVKRAQRRAQADSMPDWLHAYTVADLPAPIARKAVAIAMADFAAEHGGIHSVILDGVADLVLDVNDAEECNGLVAELHSMAIRYDCSIITVIHKNPGSEKTRGHLGSQLVRKAESNLNLEKEDEVTVVFSGQQRRAPIDRKEGPRFKWDDEMKMHMTTVAIPQAEKKVIELVDLAESVLKPGEKVTWKDLVAGLKAARSTPDKTPATSSVERWIAAMKKHEILVVSFGAYSLNPKYQLQPAAA